MRKFFFLCLALCLCWSTSAQNQRYHVTGTAEGTVDGDTIYLAVMTGFFSLEPTDTTIVRNGGFSFDGTIDGADIPSACKYFHKTATRNPLLKEGRHRNSMTKLQRKTTTSASLWTNHTNNPTTPHCHKTYAIGHKPNWTRYVKLASLATTTTSWLISRRPSATCYCNGMRKI